MIYNNNCTGIHVIDVIKGIYVGNVYDAKDNNEQVGQKETLQKLHRNHIEIDRKLLEPRVSSATDKFVTTTQMASHTGKSRKTIATRIKELQE